MVTFIIFCVTLIFAAVVLVIKYRKQESEQLKLKEEKARDAARYQAHIDTQLKIDENKRLNRLKYLEDTAQDATQILEFEIAGLYYRPSFVHDEASYLNIGSLLELKLNPSNEYDECAVKIMSGSVHLGFVPQIYSEEVFKAIRAKRDYITIVLDNDKGAIPHIRVKLYPIEDRRLLDIL